MNGSYVLLIILCLKVLDRLYTHRATGSVDWYEKIFIVNKLLEINFKDYCAIELHVLIDSCNSMLDTAQRCSSQEIVSQGLNLKQTNKGMCRISVDKGILQSVQG